MEVKLTSHTPEPEKTMVYVARVSNPANQGNPKYSELLRYCIDNKHWSIFEHSTMTLEIQTHLAIATQILRHASFRFQMFSQRYADASILAEIPVPQLRRQDTGNRQNSFDDLPVEIREKFTGLLRKHFDESLSLYREMLEAGVAKESARFVLPQATMTRLYMTGNCRSWIHYLELRKSKETQKEHRDVANEALEIFKGVYPNVSEALGW